MSDRVRCPGQGEGEGYDSLTVTGNNEKGECYVIKRKKINRV